MLCGSSKKTHLINTTSIIKNTATKIFIKSAGGDCKMKNTIYAVRCKKHDLLYISQTGDILCNRMSKHNYNLIDRPNINELTKHLAEQDYFFETDIDVSILMKNVRSLKQREMMKDKIILTFNLQMV